MQNKTERIPAHMARGFVGAISRHYFSRETVRFFGSSINAAWRLEGPGWAEYVLIVEDLRRAPTPMLASKVSVWQAGSGGSATGEGSPVESYMGSHAACLTKAAMVRDTWKKEGRIPSLDDEEGV